MKTPSFLLVAAALALLPLTASAADGAMPAPAQPSSPAAAPANPGPDKAMKPHSHMEEKSGVSQATPAGAAKKPHASRDKTRHFHPRDMK